jgi:biopolymer transport protein TolR
MSRRPKRRLMGSINVVPYIDVMLVLLIIFMITAPLLQQGVTVDLPNADAAPLDPSLLEDNEQLILSIDAAGQFFLNLGEDPEAPVDEETVLTVASAVVRRNAETPVLVKADQAVPHGRVMTGYVLLQQAGAQRLGILTDPAEEQTE